MREGIVRDVKVLIAMSNQKLRRGSDSALIYRSALSWLFSRFRISRRASPGCHMHGYATVSVTGARGLTGKEMSKADWL